MSSQGFRKAGRRSIVTRATNSNLKNFPFQHYPNQVSQKIICNNSFMQVTNFYGVEYFSSDPSFIIFIIIID